MPPFLTSGKRLDALALLTAWLILASFFAMATASYQEGVFRFGYHEQPATHQDMLKTYIESAQEKEQEMKRFIVEFTNTTHYQKIESVSATVAKHIESQGYVVKQTHTYDDRQAFWGATYHVSPATSGQNHDPHRVIAGVQRVPNVARVWPDYQRVPLAHGNHGLARRRHAKQPVPLHNTKPANGTKTPPTGNADDFPPHVITGVAQQHALGRLGKGVTICTVDTGVDYSTPSLNAGRAAGVPCIGPECQVLGGRDFITDPFDGETPKEGPLNYKDVQHPDSSCWHGTHTAGTIIARDTAHGFVGVVPEAKLRHYKVFACTSIDPKTNKTTPGGGGGYLSILLASYLQAKKDGCDVMSLSLGGPGQWGKDAADMLQTRLSPMMPFVVSNGNSGDGGLYTGADSAGTTAVIAAAAGYANGSASWGFWLDSDPKRIYSEFSELPFALNTTKDSSYPIYFTPEAVKSVDVINDGCHVKNGSLPDLKGHAVFVFRGGECDGGTKFRPFYEAGARIIIAIADFREPFALAAFSESQPGRQAGIMRREDGQAIREAFIKSQGKVKAVFPGTPKLVFAPERVPGTPTFFSSQGPTWRGEVKPNVNAPGWNILSSAPVPWEASVKSGTSMSAPLIAGVVALFKSIHRNASTEDVRSAITLSSVPYRGINTSDELASVLAQGAGTVNATAMIELTTRTQPTYFALRDSVHFEGKHQLEITNIGGEAQTYSFDHKRAKCLYALHEGAPKSGDRDEGLWALRPEECPDDTSLTVEPKTIKVDPNKTGSVTVTFKPPSPSPRLKMYSGWLLLNSSSSTGGGVIPYAGTGGDLQATGSFDHTFDLWNTTLPALFDAADKEQIQNDTTTFVVDSNSSTWPAVLWSQALASPLSTCDLVRADINFKATQPIVEAPSKLGNLFNSPGVPYYSSTRRAVVEAKDIPVVARYWNYTFADSRDSADITHRRGAYSYSFCNIKPEAYNLSDPGFAAFNVSDGYYRLLIRLKQVYSSDDTNHEDQYTSYLSHAFHFVNNVTAHVKNHTVDAPKGKPVVPSSNDAHPNKTKTGTPPSVDAHVNKTDKGKPPSGDAHVNKTSTTVPPTDAKPAATNATPPANKGDVTPGAKVVLAATAMTSAKTPP